MIRAMQYMTIARSRPIADALLAELRAIDGFLGGRVIELGAGWTVQAYYEGHVEAPPAGCRNILIPESQADALGITLPRRQEEVPA